MHFLQSVINIAYLYNIVKFVHCISQNGLKLYFCAFILYILNDEGLYELADVKASRGVVESTFLKGFKIDLEYLFA